MTQYNKHLFTTSSYSVVIPYNIVYNRITAFQLSNRTNVLLSFPSRFLFRLVLDFGKDRVSVSN